MVHAAVAEFVAVGAGAGRGAEGTEGLLVQRVDEPVLVLAASDRCR